MSFERSAIRFTQDETIGTEKSKIKRCEESVRVFPIKNCGTATQALPEYYYPSGASVVPWAKPVLGKWGLRDAYVLEMKRLPAFDSGYCYSNRVLYIDAETYFPLATELYDHDGKLYKPGFPFSQ